MKEENRKYMKQLAEASTIGFEVAFSVFIGLGIGIWLDKSFDTSPWLTLLFLVFGLAAAALNYYRFIVRQQKQDQDEKDSKK